MYSLTSGFILSPSLVVLEPGLGVSQALMLPSNLALEALFSLVLALLPFLTWRVLPPGAARGSRDLWRMSSDWDLSCPRTLRSRVLSCFLPDGLPVSLIPPQSWGSTPVPVLPTGSLSLTCGCANPQVLGRGSRCFHGSPGPLAGNPAWNPLVSGPGSAPVPRVGG